METKYVKATIIPNEMKVLIESGSQTKKSQRDKWKYELHSVTPRTKVPPSLHCHSQGGNNEVRVLVASGTSVVGQATVERLVEHAGMSVWLTWGRTLRYSVRIIISYVTLPITQQPARKCAGLSSGVSSGCCAQYNIWIQTWTFSNQCSGNLLIWDCCWWRYSEVGPS